MPSVVVSQRWDQLGGRLNALVNALSVAETLGLDFRFIWPRGSDPAIADPAGLFNSAYLERFEVSPTAIENKAVVSAFELVRMTEHEARKRFGTSDSELVIDVTDPLGTICFLDTDAEVARTRFIRCFEAIGWNAGAQSLLDLVHGWSTGDGLSAVHVRAGDIVTGGWRQMIYHGKYTPTPFVRFAIEKLAGSGAASVLLTSDNPSLLAWMRQRHRTVVTAAELIPGYGELPEVLRAFADILLLSRCTTIVGSPTSAFSRFAARLGCGQVTSADLLVPAGRERAVLKAGILETEPEVTQYPFLGGLLARDIVWCLDVFGDEMPLREQLEYAGHAIELDPDLGCARTRVALIAALVGDWKRARAEAALAVAVARAVDRHHDPMVEALATEIAVACSIAIFGQGRDRSVGSPGPLGWPRSGRGVRRWRRRMAAARMEVHRNRALFPLYSPYITDRAGVVLNVQRLEAILAALSTASDDVLRQVGVGLARWRPEDVDISQIRSSGLGALRADDGFDAVVDNVERTVIYLSLAIGLHLGSQGLGSESEEPTASRPAKVDGRGEFDHLE